MKSIIKNKHIFVAMERLAPKSLAYDWDNVGLQVGSYDAPVSKIMVTLDVLEDVVDEAIAKNVSLIIAHHPLLFKPVNQLHTETAQGRVLKKLLQHNISVYAAHTNLDIAEGGVNDVLCEKLGITNTKPLIVEGAEQLKKLVVYVPQTHQHQVRDAMGNAGAGYIGNYSHCTFQTLGEGTFKPLAGTDPYIGSQDKMEFVQEVRIETIVQDSLLQKVLAATKAVHPYEEVAYDIFPLKTEGQKYGLGRIGKLNNGMSLRELSMLIKERLDLPGTRVTGDLDSQVKKVAVLGGSGEKYIRAARNAGADTFITGDLTFHSAQDAWQMGLSLIDPGHYAEKVMKESILQYLEKEFSTTDIKLLASSTNTDPFQFI
ncbi:Nif3-like dinuclear metal center hexameric protein [Oceanobacillus manasiensis]|uniref:Nif3-like dinuclear metal center hexameric protein n=1 Tax=Oceanobacillus manasiensis TaxID=586413 RepID=UPI0005A80A64|nr:Nif3-like dinuclear metal center hexameric protein [Oceanobacillus manasiensis]